MIGYDVKRMYHQARGFQLAAERCLETKENDEQKWLPIQAIVCYAFACEIFMKAICIFESTKVHGHYLDELFDKLPPKYQMQLLKKLSVTYSELQIKHLLQQFKKIFEEYRYVYEQSSEDRTQFEFLFHFSNVLEELVGKITWIEVLRMAGEDCEGIVDG